MAISYVLGQRHDEHATGQPYESGILSEGSARVHVSSKFYLVAMFFVIFDLEAIFIFAWAIAARELGWAGYWGILVFVTILLAALAYLWRLGALIGAPGVAPSARVTDLMRWSITKPDLEEVSLTLTKRRSRRQFSGASFFPACKTCWGGAARTPSGRSILVSPVAMSKWLRASPANTTLRASGQK